MWSHNIIRRWLTQRDTLPIVGAMTNSAAQRLGTYIRALRDQLRWTQGDLANALGMGVMTVQRLEAGTRPTNVDELVSIAALFNIPVTLFMEPLNDLDDPRWSTQPVMYDWLRRAAMEWVDRGFPRLDNQDGQVSTPRLDRLVAEEMAGALAAVAAGRAQGGVADATHEMVPLDLPTIIDKMSAQLTEYSDTIRNMAVMIDDLVARVNKMEKSQDGVDN